MFIILYKPTTLFRVIKNEIRSLRTKTIAQKISTDEAMIKKQHRTILQKHLGLNQPQSLKFVSKLKLSSTSRFYNLEKTVLKLKRLGISNEDILKHPQCLNNTDLMLDNNALYLKEAGYKKLDATTLIKFRSLIRKPLNLLKVHNVINARTDVVKKLCSYLKPNPINSLLTELNDENSLVQLHDVIFESFLISLGTNNYEARRLCKTYDSIKNKSFQLISEILEILTKQMEFDNKKILQHLYILEIHPKCIKKIIRMFPMLGGLDIKDVFYKAPKLMAVPAENIKEILGHLHCYKISDEAIQRCFEIFTLSPDTVLTRLQAIEKTPEFLIYKNNPRILLLLLAQNKVKMRMEILKNNNVKCSSLHILCSPSNVFERYALEGNDRTKGSDIINYLHLEFKRPIKEIRESLSCNPHWYHVPFTSIQTSYEFLKSKGYKSSDIGKFPVILLYTKDKLEEILLEVNKKIIETNKIVDKTQMLNLCLYLLEKPYHFSGNGLWDTNVQQVQEK